MRFWRLRRQGSPCPVGPRTAGQRVCIGLALLVMLGGAVALILSCYPGRPSVPTVPPLPPAPPAVSMPAQVKVLLAQAEATVSCAGGGTWHAGAPEGNPVLTSGSGPWEVRAEGGEVLLNGERLGARAVLYPNRERFSLNGRVYRGQLAAVAGDGGLRLFNELSPELYLRSVVGSELYAGWPLDVHMAQAVAARAYLLYTQQSKGYLTLLDLAYRGVEAESRNPDLGVELTQGVIITYNGRPFPVYFHSTCGGHTAPVTKVFNDPPIAPLAGVRCDWCRQSTAYRWRVRLSATEIAQALSDRGIRRVRTLEPLGMEPEGRARTILVNGAVEVDANAFRLAVGPGRLKSTRFEVTAQGDEFLFEGTGYGHGVGLCQWGAWGLAREGYDWRAILAHYYPGTAIEQVD